MSAAMPRTWSSGLGRIVALGAVSLLIAGLAAVLFVAAYLLLTAPDISSDDGMPAVIIATIGLLLTAVLVPIVREFSIALRYRLVMDTAGLAYRVPAPWIGLSPFPHFLAGRIAWHDVVAVDRHNEVVRMFGGPTTFAAISVLSRDGLRVGPAKTKAGPHSGLPVGAIADLIAQATGQAVRDLGTVEAPGPLAVARDAAPWTGNNAPRPLGEKEPHQVSRREQRIVQVIAVTFTATAFLRACNQDW